MNYEEFSELKEIKNPTTDLVKFFQFDSGETFFIEPPFYTQLMGLKEIYPNEFQKVIDQIKNIAKQRKYVGFVYDFEHPFIQVDGYIYLEFGDVTDSVKVFYEDKSRGSDYGD